MPWGVLLEVVFSHEAEGIEKLVAPDAVSAGMTVS
jgi:hypothetical protein